MNRTLKINRNTLWAESFVNELAEGGVRYVCISPGSRSTALTLAFANHPKIKSYVHIDERSGGFFALGIAKQLNEPVALVSTSGTAAAEFYPAVIEAFQQHISLIVCTADRPPELIDCGANQTINQNNLYANHIRWFFDVGVPDLTPQRLRHIRVMARRAIHESTGYIKGPVHLNFQFRKPFEPDVYTDEISPSLLEYVKGPSSSKDNSSKGRVKILPSDESLKKIVSVIQTTHKGLLIVGPGEYSPSFAQEITSLSETLGFPILADGASQIRFGSHSKKNILTHYDAILKSKVFKQFYIPDLIIQFGSTVSSKGLEQFLLDIQPFHYHVNEHARWIDPSSTLTDVVVSEPTEFCTALHRIIRQVNYDNNSKWLGDFKRAETISAKVREQLVDCTDSLFEGKIIRICFDVLPEETSIMVSNSMPIRDLDYFVPVNDKRFRILTNRGASGIDGITSTAFGIAAVSRNPTVLITGDLAFYHDINGLIAARKYNIPLVVILINNNGGGIFEMLPIAHQTNVFREYFTTPHDINFEPIVTAFGGKYTVIKKWDELYEELGEALTRNTLSVLEIPTDARSSTELRRKYRSEVDENLRREFSANDPPQRT